MPILTIDPNAGRPTPLVYDPVCGHCAEPFEFRLHPDASICSASCRCGGPGFKPGEAYPRAVWVALAALQTFHGLIRREEVSRTGWRRFDFCESDLGILADAIRGLGKEPG